MFSRLDADSDGRISILEFTASWHDAPFELWEQDDVDGNGYITKAEFGSRNIKSHPKQPAADHFRLIDENNDGCISAEEFNADWHMPPDDLFEKEDRNGDGCIRRSEFGKSAPPPDQP